MAGRKHSKESLAKMSASHRANPVSGPKHHMFNNGHMVTGAKNPFYGRKHSEATKAKMRAAHKARKETTP